jgi:hypothetical protein
MGENEAPAPGDPKPEVKSLLSNPEGKPTAWIEPHDSRLEINAIRQEIEEIGTHNQSTTSDKVADKSIVKSKNRLKTWSMPSSDLLNKTFARGISIGGGLMVGGIASGSVLAAVRLLDFIPGGPIPLGILYGSVGLTGIGTMALLGAMTTYLVEAAQLTQNTHSYSELLTVSKVSSKYCDAAKQLTPNEDVVGELHLVGKLWGNVKIPQNPRDVVRSGMKGLYNLAEACERGDSSVNGLSVFVAKSKIIDRSYERFGFKVEDFIDRRSRFKKLLDKPGEILLHAISRMRKYEVHQVRDENVAAISREDLISHKNQFKKLAGLKE